jgi:predicted metal-binding protein
MITGYRYLATVMQAVEAGLIETVGRQSCTTQNLLDGSDMRRDEGERFVETLISIGIFERYGDLLYLSGFSRNYLFSGSAANQLDTLEFERLLVEKWHGLGPALRAGQSTSASVQPGDDYRDRLVLFQQAMHEAAVVRSKELWERLSDLPESGLIIDIGAGDGTYLREFLVRYPCWSAVACDLQDVLDLNAAALDDAGIVCRPCNIADQDERAALVAEYAGRCTLLLLSNLIHCYSLPENEAILASVGKLPADDGLLVIHDFFRDGNSFGALYDLHMLANTYNGRSYRFDEVSDMLQRVGFGHSDIVELPSYSHAVVAYRQAPDSLRRDPLFQLRQQALALGFFETAPLEPATIISEPWVKAKCAYGCPCYGKKWSCPPHSMDNEEFHALLKCYSRALLVVGQAPLKEFQGRLLELEKAAFLNGHKKALVFTGGPCCWCDQCPDDRCIFPEKRRPSLESCGCDVFALAESAGIRIAPLRNSDDFVQFIGLLLVE